MAQKKKAGTSLYIFPDVTPPKRSAAAASSPSGSAAYAAYPDVPKISPEIREDIISAINTAAPDLSSRNKKAYEKLVAEFSEKGKALNADYDSSYAYYSALLDADLESLGSEKAELYGDYADSAREAYLNFMKQKRLLPESLASRGLSGGYAQKALNKAGNDYLTQLSELGSSYQSSEGAIDQKQRETVEKNFYQNYQRWLDYQKSRRSLLETLAKQAVKI